MVKPVYSSDQQQCFADKKKMASNKKFLSCEFRTKQMAITRLYNHVIIGNKVFNTVLVCIHMQFIETFRFDLRLCGSHLGGPDGWRKQGLPIAFWIHIAQIGIKTVSEVKLKQIFKCCVCSVDLSMFLVPFWGFSGRRQVKSNLIMHIHKWLPNKAKRSMVYHKLTTLFTCSYDIREWLNFRNVTHDTQHIGNLCLINSVCTWLGKLSNKHW